MAAGAVRIKVPFNARRLSRDGLDMGFSPLQAGIYPAVMERPGHISVIKPDGSRVFITHDILMRRLPIGDLEWIDAPPAR